MKTKTNTFNVLFHLRNSSAKEDRLPIYARITVNGKRIELSVKQMIHTEDWNDDRGIANPKRKNAGS